ncbi:MAG: hypothetical protein H8E37_03410 [Planctomycetes bacterium]|nr:hypothetical protein [Planctomycetota bacterium]
MSAETPARRRASITLLEGLVLLGALVGLVWLISWGVQRTKNQAMRSEARELLKGHSFILVLDQKDHVALSDSSAGSSFERPLIQSDGRPVRTVLLEDIALFDETQILKLRNSFLRDHDLKTLATLKELRELDISGSLITDEGLAALTAFPQLEELDISLTRVRGPGLRHLQKLEKLRRLRVTNNEIPDSAMPCIEMLSQLESIDVMETWLSDDSKEKLNDIRVRQSHRNRFIEFDQMCSESQHFYGASIARSKVSALSLAWVRKVKAVVPPDGRITRLALPGTDLRLPRFPSSGRSEHYRLRLPHLQYLNLSHTRFDEKRSPTFGVMSDLRELNIVASDCGDEAFRRLRGCDRLKTLDARLCGLTDAALSTVGSLKRLETLRLGQNDITDAKLKDLLTLKKLERLELDSCDITDAGLDLLAELPDLKLLSVSRSYVTTAGVERLKKACPKLEVRVAGVPAVAATNELVGQFNRTREAQIIERLEENGFKCYVEGSYGRTIQVTFPTSDKATDEDMKWIGRLTGLRKIQGDKSDSQVTAKGVRELAELQELTELHLRSSQLDGPTLNELAKFPKLDRSYLYSPSITENDVAEAATKFPQHEMSWNSAYVRIFFNYNKAE